jgi:hypothetical protein
MVGWVKRSRNPPDRVNPPDHVTPPDHVIRRKPVYPAVYSNHCFTVSLASSVTAPAAHPCTYASHLLIAPFIGDFVVFIFYLISIASQLPSRGRQ